MTNTNVDGRHELLIVLAPVREGLAAELTTYLLGLGASPFARLPRTQQLRRKRRSLRHQRLTQGLRWGPILIGKQNIC